MILLQKKRPGSIFKRFFVLTTLTVVFCITVASFSLMFFFVSFWKSERLTSLSDDALSLARSVEALYDADDEEKIFSLTDEGASHIIAEALSAHTNVSETEIFLTDTAGRIVLCEDNLDISADNIFINGVCSGHTGCCFKDEILTGAADAYPQSYQHDGAVFDDNSASYFLAAVPLYFNGSVAGYVILMQSVTDAYVPYTTEFIRMILFTGFIGVFLAAVSSFFVSYRMVKPLRKITAVTKKYATGNFEERIKTVETYNELQDFVDAFNSMADTLAVVEESRSSFVANVSHELKTPMTIINGFVDAILDGTINEEDREKYLMIVSEESKRLSKLVIAMLNMSKIEAGKLTLSLSDIRLNTMLCNTLVGFEKSITEKNINITGLEELENVTVYADDALINQVIYNLIDNAVKFTEKGGTVSFSLTSDKNYGILTIRNTGTGIPEEECELIFDRFYKLDKSRGLDGRSFGLGLHIVKSIIELHKGTISINSSENEFTEFTVKIPLFADN